MFAVSAETLVTCKLNSCKPSVLQPINHSSATSRHPLDTIFYIKPIKSLGVAQLDRHEAFEIQRRPEFVTRTCALFACYCAVVIISEAHVWLTAWCDSAIVPLCGHVSLRS